ncbi:putative membrane protein [Bradyrhizobium sp. GM0.4]
MWSSPLGTQKGMFASAAAGAIAACSAVLLLGLAIHRPLARVPENVLKFVVGVLLSAFGVFWTGEALGVAWPGADLAVIALARVFLGAGCVTVVLKMLLLAGTVLALGCPVVLVLNTLRAARVRRQVDKGGDPI